MKTFSIFKVTKRCFLIGIITVLLVSCGKGVDVPDVSHISADVKVKPFYQDLFALNVDELSSQFPQLEDKYGKLPNDIVAYMNKTLFDFHATNIGVKKVTEKRNYVSIELSKEKSKQPSAELV